MEEEIRYTVPCLSVPRVISMVETPLTCIVETNLLRDHTDILDLDSCVDHVSVGLDQDLYAENLIELVKVRYGYNLKISLAHTNRKHHEVTKDMLVMKWEIYNSKAKTTLEATTNMLVRHDILPLSRIYWTYLLSLRLRHLKMQCFTDTLFVGVKSLIGNTCAQLFTDSKYIYIHKNTELNRGYRYPCCFNEVQLW